MNKIAAWMSQNHHYKWSPRTEKYIACCTDEGQVYSKQSTEFNNKENSKHQVVRGLTSDKFRDSFKQSAQDTVDIVQLAGLTVRLLMSVRNQSL